MSQENRNLQFRYLALLKTGLWISYFPILGNEGYSLGVLINLRPLARWSCCCRFCCCWISHRIAGYHGWCPLAIVTTLNSGNQSSWEKRPSFKLTLTLNFTHHGVHLVTPGASVGDHGAGSVAPIIGHRGPGGGGGDGSAAFCKESNHAENASEETY